MNRFFNKEPKEGQPISLKGFARGIRKMAHALSNMEMIGGHIEWSVFGVPRFVVDPTAIRDLMLEGGLSGVLPNGTEIPGEVWYDTISHKLKQHILVWNSETRVFDESETSTDIATLYSHDLAHGVTE